MKITVILCTFNRCPELQKALASVAECKMPESAPWEVLVVDNNSTDQTRWVVEGFSCRYPGRFRYWFEPRPGKSYALNAGIREALGQILVFTDDDVTFEPTWLEKLTAALDDGEWAGAGGRIILAWPDSIPRWLSVEGPYSRHPFPGLDHGPKAGELPGPPFGANMAFRKSLFEKYGDFRTDLGPSPDRSIPPHSEDTEFGRRVMLAGERLRYEPSAVVYHPVAQTRINQRYFLAWWFDRGRAEVREFGHGPGARCYRGIPLPLLSRLAVWTVRWIATLRPHIRFYRKLVVWEKAGQVTECYRIANIQKR